MDQVSRVKRQIRIEQWRKNITECQASGIEMIHPVYIIKISLVRNLYIRKYYIM